VPIENVTTVPAAAGASLYAAPAARTPKQSMDGDLFMSLLVTQLQNQDPSSPMDTNAMISQFTELAMMEKTDALAATSAEGFSLQMRMAAASLIGQAVSYTGDDGQDVSGTARSVSYTHGVPTVNVDGTDVPLDSISAVSAATA